MSNNEFKVTTQYLQIAEVLAETRAKHEQTKGKRRTAHDNPWEILDGHDFIYEVTGEKVDPDTSDSALALMDAYETAYFNAYDDLEPDLEPEPVPVHETPTMRVSQAIVDLMQNLNNVVADSDASEAIDAAYKAGYIEGFLDGKESV